MSHDHDHAVADYNRAFALGVGLNIAFVVVESAFGLSADSLALVADAGHNLSDVLSLLLAWGAHRMATAPSSGRRTYGFRKLTVMASLASAILLLVALGGIAWEALGRLAHPRPAAGGVIISVATIGFLVNAATALLFVSGRKSDLNIRGAFLHMAADAGVSLGVVVAGLAIALTGLLWIDPAISLAIVVVIFIGTWSLLRDSFNLSIDAVPREIDPEAVKTYLAALPSVMSLHDLHIWALSTTEAALTVHLVCEDDGFGGDQLGRVQRELLERFGIRHATLQIESESSGDDCLLKPPGCC